MSTVYHYENKPNSLVLTYIHDEVTASAMTDKSIEYCRWDEDGAHLCVTFTNELSAGDKTILDGIVEDCPLNGVA